MPDIYLAQDGKQAGPYQVAQVRQFLAEGKITGETPAWHSALSDWTTVAAVLAQFPATGMPGNVPPPPPSTAPRKGKRGCLIAAIVVGGLMVLLLPCCAGVALGPITAGIKKAQENASMQTARAIALAMSQYAADHQGAYPDGRTSTEVFQKLIDGKYVSDPGIFYLAMPGKTKATATTLTAENVGYDVTSGVTTDSSGDVPVVFCTGYTVTYTAGASALRDGSSVTPFPGPLFAGLAVAYRNGNGQFITAEKDGTAPNLVPASFDAGGKTYRQLRP